MNWSPKQTKIIHVILTNQEGKWKSISLSNLVPQISVAQAQQVMDHVWPQLITTVEDRATRLREVNAPACILEPQQKMVGAVRRQVHPSLAALKRRIKQ